jgi:hypothetical protein
MIGALGGAAVGALITGAFALHNNRLATELAKFTEGGNNTRSTAEIQAAATRDLHEYQRTKRSEHLLPLFLATDLPNSPPSNARFDIVDNKLRLAYLGGAGMFLGDASDAYHRATELLTLKELKDLPPEKAEHAAQRILSSLRSALIVAVEGSTQEAPKRKRATVEGFLRDTEFTTNANAVLEYLADLEEHLKGKPTSRHSWLSPTDLEAKMTKEDKAAVPSWWPALNPKQRRIGVAQVQP